MVKTIRLSEETHKRLEEFGNKGDSFEDIVIRLLDLTKVGGKRK